MKIGKRSIPPAPVPGQLAINKPAAMRTGLGSLASSTLFGMPDPLDLFHRPIGLSQIKQNVGDRNTANPVGGETVTQVEAESVFFGKL